METEFTADQVRDLIGDAVRTALTEANTVPPDARPAGSGGQPAIIRQRPQRFRLFRALRAAQTGNWKGAEFEHDFVTATRAALSFTDDPATRDDDDYDPERGILMPTTRDAWDAVVEYGAFRMDQASSPFAKAANRTMAVRAISEAQTVAITGDTGGGALTQPEFLNDQFVYSLQSAVAVPNAPGVEDIPVTTSVLNLPRETTLLTGGAYAEGATITESDSAFARQQFIIRKVAVYSQYSNELLADANPALNAYLARSLARRQALTEDLQELTGNGTAPNLQGFQTYSGTTTGYTAATNGDSWSATGALDHLVDMVYSLRSANVEPNAWIMHPRTLQSLAKVKDSNGRYLLESVGGNFGAPAVIPNAGALSTLAGPAVGTPWRAMLLGYPVLLSAQIPINLTQGTSLNATFAILGDFNFCKILRRQAIELAISEHIAFTTDQTAVRTTSRLALALTQPAAFVVQAGIIP